MAILLERVKHVERMSKEIEYMKKGNAAGLDGLMREHLK